MALAFAEADSRTAFVEDYIVASEYDDAYKEQDEQEFKKWERKLDEWERLSANAA